ncbi:hypothetical protein BX666DRAFT_1858031 [Dichotomocladium elegans]|nr:hypothetical protein BX666DRAFT_1858031 [Dichotomocladium elegans]
MTKQSNLRPDYSEHGSSISRHRQSRKDEAIRRKAEHELSRKRHGAARSRQSRKIPGTVSALRPSQALTVKENLLVVEAAQLMAAKRCDCVLVVDDEDHLSGIFTAKDLAYRVVAESRDARRTVVSKIMTEGPMCVTADTSATDALNLMVSRGFRHLPVCNSEGDIFGLLDITKCLYEALDKMERAFGSSQKLYDALEGMEREWVNSPVELVQYMEALRDRMSCPDLSSVLDGTAPAEVTVKTNIKDAARTMKEHHTTAVLVADREGLTGIFTTKDVVLRVIAAGLNPETCTVGRVMTPHPETATPRTTIMDALHRMYDGHFLNLPVLEEESVVGMVDVLKLTYATLEQIHSIEGNDGEGPMWSRFWDSFGITDPVESESQSSDPLSPSHGPPTLNAISPEPSASFSQLQGFPEITPNESASMVANNEDSLSGLSSQYLSRQNSTRGGGSGNANGFLDENMFAFKFTSDGGKTHRFTSPINNYSQLLETIRRKVIGEHIPSEADNNEHEDWLTVSYLDDENDQVLITSDADLLDSVHLARKLGEDRVKLFVHDASKPEAPRNIPQAETPIRIETSSHLYRNGPVASPITGIPQELMLPAAIAFLGVVILGVFAYSRVSPRHR